MYIFEHIVLGAKLLDSKAISYEVLKATSLSIYIKAGCILLFQLSLNTKRH